MTTISDIVRTLRSFPGVSEFLSTDKNGNIPIYQMISADAQCYPHIAVFETARTQLFCDDVPMVECSSYRINLYSRVNNLHEFSMAVRDCLVDAGCVSVDIGADGINSQLGVFIKSVTCSVQEDIMDLNAY